MPQTTLTVRNSVRAYIRRGNEILVQLKMYENGISRFALPGGAVDPGETLGQGLQRECMEEIGAEIEIIDLMHLADYFKPQNTNPPSTRQQVEFIFRCRVPKDYKAHNGPKPDSKQVDVMWLPLSDLADSAMLPEQIRDILAEDNPAAPVFLGLVE